MYIENPATGCIIFLFEINETKIWVRKKNALIFNFYQKEENKYQYRFYNNNVSHLFKVPLKMDAMYTWLKIC